MTEFGDSVADPDGALDVGGGIRDGVRGKDSSGAVTFSTAILNVSTQ